MNGPLAHYPIVSTCDPERAEAVLSRELTDLRMVRVGDRRGFRLEMQGVRLGRMLLGYNRFDADTVLDIGDVDDALVLVIGVETPAVFEIDGETIVTTDRAAVVSPSRKVIIHRPPGSDIFVVRTSLDVVKDRFREITGRRPRAMSFESGFDLSSDMGVSIRQAVQFMADAVQRDESILGNPLIRSGFNEMLLNTIVALPGSHRDAVLHERSPVAPGIVRRAEEYLEARAAEPVTITDLVRQLECSRNSLFGAFRRFRGYTPMQFLENVRLDRVRAFLANPEHGDSVTSVALANGFVHLGRFSRTYRRRFSENPSETLLKARDN